MDREDIKTKESFARLFGAIDPVDMDNTMLSTLLLAVYMLNEGRKYPEEIHNIIVNSCYLAKAFEDGGNTIL